MPKSGDRFDISSIEEDTIERLDKKNYAIAF